MGFPRQEYWSGLPPRDLPDPGIEPVCKMQIPRSLPAILTSGLGVGPGLYNPNKSCRQRSLRHVRAREWMLSFSSRSPTNLSVRKDRLSDPPTPTKERAQIWHPVAGLSLWLCPSFGSSENSHWYLELWASLCWVHREGRLARPLRPPRSLVFRHQRQTQELLILPYGGLPWWSSGWDSMHPMQGSRVQSQARELDPTCHN